MKNILILDDDPVICALLKSFLSLRRYKVESITVWEDALKQMAKESFEIILTDLQMPGIGGAEIIKKIRDINPNVKLIAMSGDTSFDKLPANLKAHIPFLPKPFKLQEVEKLLISLNSPDQKE